MAYDLIRVFSDRESSSVWGETNDLQGSAGKNAEGQDCEGGR